ncbi:MAG: hypothetical protein R2731_10690 [Nocardioides sp.]
MHTLETALAALAVLSTSGCVGKDAAGDPAGGGTEDAVTEASLHGDRVCPSHLRGRPTDNHGFGTEQIADRAPELLTPDAAWVCAYAPVDTSISGTNAGAAYRWVRTGEVRQVAAADLATLSTLLGQLAPADPSQDCTADLGLRHMLLTSHDGDLTGVVVDGYGCGDVRLTDEPFRTPPGRAIQPGTVSGVLTAPPALHRLVRSLGHSDG